MSDNFDDRVRLHELAHREAGGVSRRQLASWQRSEDYGVPTLRELANPFGEHGIGMRLNG